MYEPGRRLNGFTDSLTQIISAGAQAYKTVTQPNYSPFTVAPYQGPNINPVTGQTIYYDKYGNPQTTASYPFPGNIFNAPDMTVPLLIGGGLLLLYLSRRKRA